MSVFCSACDYANCTTQTFDTAATTECRMSVFCMRLCERVKATDRGVCVIVCVLQCISECLCSAVHEHRHSEMHCRTSVHALACTRFLMHCRTQTFHTRYCNCYLFIHPSLPPARPPFSTDREVAFLFMHVCMRVWRPYHIGP